MSKPRILLIPDTPGWAFDANLRDMAHYLGEWFDFEFWYAENGPPEAEYGERFDAWFCPWHSLLWNWDAKVPQLGSLRSYWFDIATHCRPTLRDVDLVNQYAGFHVVTEHNYDELRPVCPRVVYLTNPVNCERFPFYRRTDDSLVACWAGNTAHLTTGGERDAKGLHTIIEPACFMADAPLQIAEFNTQRILPEKMPEFYYRATVALCASEYEGASNFVMEAMACGCAVIATDVGNHRELHNSQVAHLGASGIQLVDRSPAAFAEALEDMTPEAALEAGALNAQEIAERWSWQAWRERYKAFVEMAL